jgi:hypothetical protein
MTARTQLGEPHAQGEGQRVSEGLPVQSAGKAHAPGTGETPGALPPTPCASSRRDLTVVRYHRGDQLLDPPETSVHPYFLGKSLRPTAFRKFVWAKPKRCRAFRYEMGTECDARRGGRSSNP